MPSINDLKTMLVGRNSLAVTNRYKATFGLPSSVKPLLPKYGVVAGNYADSLNLMCDATSLPGRQIMTLDYQAHKQAVKVPYGFLNEDITFTFLLTGDYYAKKVFDAWTEAVINFKDYRAKYLDTYTTNINVYQMHKTETGEIPIYGVSLIKAYPITIGGMPLDNTAENSIQKLSVVMTYENFEVIENANLN